MIQKRGDEWCVVSDDGSQNFGCFDSEEKAVARLAQVEAHAKTREAVTGKIVTREWVRKLCPPCADKMQYRGWTSIKAEALVDAVYGMSRESDATRNVLEILAEDAGVNKDDDNDRMLGRVVEQQSDPTGRVWDVVVIREGKSGNGFVWSRERLAEITTLINANTAGVPVMSFRFETPMGPIRAHSPADMNRLGLRESDFVHSIEGAIREARIVDSGGVAEVHAKMHLTNDETIKTLMNAREAGTLRFYGISVNSQTVQKRTGGGIDIRFVGALPSSDLVNFPSAGGRLVRGITIGLIVGMTTQQDRGLVLFQADFL